MAGALHVPADGDFALRADIVVQEERSIAGPVERFFWILFVFGASGGLVVLERFGNPERLLWLAADGIAAVVLIRSSHRYFSLLASVWPLFLWPALAVLSALWSPAPFVSFYHGLQLATTLLVGVVLVQRLGTLGALRVVFWALLAAAILSFAAAQLSYSARGIRGEWLGVYSHKNSLGQAMAILFYTCVALYWAGWRRSLTTLAAAAALALIVLSRSGTSLLAVAALSVVLAALGVRLAGRSAAAMMVALGIAGAALLALVFVSANVDVVRSGLGLLGKDSTLTGRTLLWSLGWQAFLDHPILGLGFKGYWESSQDRAYLHLITGQKVWFFHNNYLEVAVAFGIVGFTIFVTTLLWVWKRVLFAFFLRPRAEHAWAVLFLTHTCLVMASENPLFFNHSLAQSLLAVASVMVLRKPRFQAGTRR